MVLWVRYAFQAVLTALWLAGVRGRRLLRTAHPRFQVLRGALLLLSSAFAFVGLQHMPVAEFTAIVMLAPVLVTVLAGWLLHEQVSRTALGAGGRRLRRRAGRHPAGRRAVRLGRAAAARRWR